MDLTNWNNLFILLGIIAIIVEIIIGAATGFELFVIGVIFILGGAIGLLTGSVQMAIVSMVVLTVIYILFGRKMIKKSLHISTTKTNIELIIGAQGTVLEPIDENGKGRVKIFSEDWRAEADIPIEKGEKVIVESVSGVTVKVRKA